MDPYIGEIRAFAGNFAPVGWALCDGSIISIAENDTLFALIGTIYGGDGQSTFGLPDLRGRAILSKGTSQAGTSYVLGGVGGAEKVAINTNEMPVHSHASYVTANPGTVSTPDGNYLAAAVEVGTNPKKVNMYLPPYALGISVKTMAPTTTVGSSQAHDNRSPYIAITYIIATQGNYPQTA